MCTLTELLLAHSAEYSARGEVSARTDAFSFGILAIELLTALHPIAVREIVDDSLFKETPSVIQQHHDGTAPPPAVCAGMIRHAKPALKCQWPPGPLQRASEVAAALVRTPAKLRSEIIDILPDLEGLVVHRYPTELGDPSGKPELPS